MTSLEFNQKIKEFEELKERMKSHRLTDFEHKRYIELNYEISEYIANEDNMFI